MVRVLRGGAGEGALWVGLVGGQSIWPALTIALGMWNHSGKLLNVGRMAVQLGTMEGGSIRKC